MKAEYVTIAPPLDVEIRMAQAPIEVFHAASNRLMDLPSHVDASKAFPEHTHFYLCRDGSYCVTIDYTVSLRIGRKDYALGRKDYVPMRLIIHVTSSEDIAK